jgi:methionyl-tRNA synthetase
MTRLISLLPENQATILLEDLARETDVTVPEVLFKKIEDEQVAEWTARFGGSDAA